MSTTCDFGKTKWTEICLLVETPFFKSNTDSQIILHTIAVIMLILSGYFSVQVIFLFVVQVKNFFAGQTNEERFGDTNGEKTDLAKLNEMNNLLSKPET